ncbi:MAG TPA: GDP-mannose 4,6-dehydratase, partial [Oligoflexia bacterium]|nr:GDP-mannose 4,6-dehydratase [Oligoflexia bacterium]
CDFKPEVVFHLAAQMNVRRSVEAPVFDTHENVVGTVNMVEAARCAGSRFVFSSTGGAIYGEQDLFPADETHAIRPKCPYGVSKRAAELYLEYYGREYAMVCTALRFGNVYGPRQNPFGEAGVVAIFAKKALRGEILRINGDGKQTRDFVHVQDVVRACMAAAVERQDAGFDVFNVGTGRECSVNDIVAGFRAVWPQVAAEGAVQSFAVEHGPALAGEQMRSVIDAAKLSKRFGWQARVRLEEGLLQTILSFR